jgi:hypothetical protein
MSAWQSLGDTASGMTKQVASVAKSTGWLNTDSDPPG